MGYVLAGCLLYVLLIPGMYVVIQPAVQAIEPNAPSTEGWITSVFWPITLVYLLIFVLVFLVCVVIYAPYLVAKGGRPELDRWLAE